MAKRYGDSDHNSNEERWDSQEPDAKNDEFIRSLQPVVPPQEAAYTPNIYPTTAEEIYDLDYGYDNQGYFIPAEAEFPSQIPQNSGYKVVKRSNRLRRMPSRPLFIPPHGAFVPPPNTTTPPGSAGVPGPLSTAPFMRQQQEFNWLDVPASSTSTDTTPPAQTKSSTKKTTKVSGQRTKATSEQPSRLGPVARNKFTLEEDERILKLRFTGGLSWSIIASNFMPHRSEKGLQVHYSVSLKDQVRSYTREWSAEEDQAIRNLVSEHQRAMWQVIAKRFSHTVGDKEGEIAATACYARYRRLVRLEEDELEAAVQRSQRDMRDTNKRA